MLQLHDIGKRYGNLTVLDGMSLQLAPGEALGIIGPNGAGKTTLFSVVSGQVAPDRGRVMFQGRDVSRLGAHQRCHLGMGRTFQVPRPFVGMTVFESARVAARFGAGLRAGDADDLAVSVVERTGLIDRINTPCAELTLLDRKRLELTRALATAPTLLLLDEIGGGLTDQEMGQLTEILASVRAQGVAMIWIEHIVRALTAFVDRLLVINFGTVLARGNPHEVMGLPAVHEIYMGLDADAAH